MTTDIVKLEYVQFKNYQIQAVMKDEKIYVVFKPLTRQIGLGHASQTQVLKKKSWASVTTIVTVAHNGSIQPMDCISLRTMVMWLANIDENRVAPHVKQAVVDFQCEAADVLEAYFLGKLDNEQVSIALVNQAEDTPEHWARVKEFIKALGKDYPRTTVNQIILTDFLKEKGYFSTKKNPIHLWFGDYVIEEYELVMKKTPKKGIRKSKKVNNARTYTWRDRWVLERAWIKFQGHFSLKRAICK